MSWDDAKITIRFLREQTEILEAAVSAGRYATKEELDAYRPGGVENPRKSMGGWIRWYATLVRLNAQEHQRREVPVLSADAMALERMSEQPKVVQIHNYGPDRISSQLLVHPKGLDALFNCHCRDWLLGVLLKWSARLKEGGTATDLALLERVMAEVSYQYGLLLWAVCSPGPQNPYDWKGDRPELPEWVTWVQPWDVLRVLRAHSQVNGRDLMALDLLVSPTNSDEGDGLRRPSWSVFAATVAMELGMNPASLMRDMSLASVMTTWRLAQGAKAEAIDNAKKKSRRRRPASGEA